MGLRALLIFSCFSAIAAQQTNCEWILGRDCTAYGMAPVCGNNGITYKNRCELSQAACKDSSITILHDGACTPTETSTTPPPVIINGEEAIVDLFCTALSHTSCGSEVQLVCASDGRTYGNYCEYDKAKCTHREMYVVSFGACKTH